MLYNTGMLRLLSRYAEVTLPVRYRYALVRYQYAEVTLPILLQIPLHSTYALSLPIYKRATNSIQH
jgi:hypothetical protein